MDINELYKKFLELPPDNRNHILKKLLGKDGYNGAQIFRYMNPSEKEKQIIMENVINNAYESFMLVEYGYCNEEQKKRIFHRNKDYYFENIPYGDFVPLFENCFSHEEMDDLIDIICSQFNVGLSQVCLSRYRKFFDQGQVNKLEGIMVAHKLTTNEM